MNCCSADRLRVGFHEHAAHDILFRFLLQVLLLGEISLALKGDTAGGEFLDNHVPTDAILSHLLDFLLLQSLMTHIVHEFPIIVLVIQIN